MSVRPDPITWKQIGAGYVILICIGLGAAAAVLDPHGMASDPFRSMIGFAVLAVLYGVWKLLELPLSRASARVAPTPDGQLRLKRKAVAAMWLLSILLCIASVRVTQLVNPW